jgi:hypothetical protein
MNWALNMGLAARSSRITFSAHVSTLMANHGQGGTPPSPTPQDQFVAYYSLIDRAVSGIPISESFAWARLNAEGISVAEAVYWPLIPASAISAALELQAVLADPQAGPQYIASLTVPSSGGTVHIHHTKSFSRLPFQAQATYDVHEGPSTSYARGRTIHYSPQGAEVELPDDANAEAMAADAGTAR